jgi:hypothetical protein
LYASESERSGRTSQYEKKTDRNSCDSFE